MFPFSTEKSLTFIVFSLNLTTLRHKVVLTFELVETFCYCEHSNESHCAILSCGAVYVFYQMLVLSFQPEDETLKV